ncbi:MAG TPA: hypothetical protein VM925_26485 [Labilithrix sp.]|jgi:hypothetical protein|nr:hypothetical protein [Labilithrix sp.]
MDHLITTAWRAFWVGLGASAVLIAQGLLTPSSPAATAPAPSVEEPAPYVAPKASAKSADPILSRNPFESARTKLALRGRSAS